MRVSTMRLLFGHDSAWQKTAKGTYEEVNRITDVVTENRYNSKYEGTAFQQARFWKAIVTRFWQYDDFNFEGVAAASFLGNAHRFKIWFNPQECYKLLMTAAMGLYDSVEDPTAGNGKKKRKNKSKATPVQDEEKIKKEQEETQSEWDKLLNGKSKFEKKLLDYGWSREFWNQLEQSKEQRSWTDKGWQHWNYLMVNVPYFYQNVVSIMVHEMMHILWKHIERNGKRDPMQWNLCTDYAINQTLDFTEEVQKVCITPRNETFYHRFVISYARYSMIQDVDCRKEVEKKFGLTVTQDIEEFVEKAIPQVAELEDYFMLEGTGWYGKENKTAKKAADFYYRILQETTIFQSGNGQGEGEPQGQGQGQGGGSGVRGYDSHDQWSDTEGSGDEMDDEEDGEGSGDGDGAEEKDGKGEGDGDKDTDKDGDGGKNKKEKGTQQGGKIDQIRKAPKGNKAKSGGGGNGNGSRVKDRGKGEGEGSIHGGWDVTTACARQEAKGAVRDALKRSGFNPDDPKEIERALNRTPGMESLGAVISEWFKVRTKNWKQILAKYVATSIEPVEFDYTMSRENRRIPGLFPGSRRMRSCSIVVAVDTSGSINMQDWWSFISQIEKITKDCDLDKVRLIQCHHSIAFDKKVRLSKIKSIPVVEVGGTTMKCVYERLKRDNNRKLLVLFTDGAIDHFKNEGWGFKSIMFLSTGNECYADSLRERGFTVICQDES